jgi:hypothetical protein
MTCERALRRLHARAVAVRRSCPLVLVAFLAIIGGLQQGPALFAQGMDLRQAAGVPLPAADLPAGTVSVRVVRGSFANNLSGETVVFLVNGEERRVTTDESGRAQISGLPAGTRVKATASVTGERLESQEVTIGDSGIRFMLLATEGGAAPSAPTAVVPGTVFIGPESRIVIDYSNELLNVYYVLQVLNPESTPVDLGGPLVLELPTEARSATLMEGATPQATAANARVTVMGPFAPGRTNVNVAYTLPFNGPAARIEQRWPVPTRQFSVFALKTGEMDLASPQLNGKQLSEQQGQALVMGTTSALPAGDLLTLDVTGLPHRPTWPRNLALGAAGIICCIGLWAAFVPSSRRKAA